MWMCNVEDLSLEQIMKVLGLGRQDLETRASRYVFICMPVVFE